MDHDARDILHVTNVRFAARDLLTSAPWLFERACLRQFTTQWGDCKISRILSFNAIIIIIIKLSSKISDRQILGTGRPSV